MLPHRLYIQPNAYIRPYDYTPPHLLCINDITRTYDLTHTCGIPIFWSSYILIFQSSDLPILQSSNLLIFWSYYLPIFRSFDLLIFWSSNLPYDVAPYVSNAIYLSLYGLLWPCTTYMTFCLWNLSTITGVTPTVSNYYNNIYQVEKSYFGLVKKNLSP